MSDGWKSRLAAADILCDVERRGDLDASMARSKHFSALRGADRRFARSMAGSALRGRGRIDHVLELLLDRRSLASLSPPVRGLLRIGAAQLWLLDIADHAAVAATVEAAKHMPAAARAGALINAVLRRAARHGDLFASTPVLSVWPDWLRQTMIDALGVETATTIAADHLCRPALDIQTAANAQSWVERLEGKPIPGGVRLDFGVAPKELDGYSEGAWWVQDAAAALAVRLFGSLSGRRALDMCAAPGGKTMQLAAKGADVTALDISARRLSLLRENLLRTGLAANLVETDARNYKAKHQFDAILLDAPCSALGILRRHPEAVWGAPRKPNLYTQRQSELVQAAAPLLKRGGKLVYCVCTPVRAEGADIINAAMASGGWRRAPVAALLPDDFAHAITTEGDILTAPPKDQGLKTDIFYISMLEKL